MTVRDRNADRDADDVGENAQGDEPASTSASEAGRVPEFFIVGHQKCGTTALYLMLRTHPQLFLSHVKEPRYFAFDQRSRRAGGAGGPGRPRSLEVYRQLFAEARPDQLAGDASPQYLRSAVAAGAIAEVRPDARIIAILREPAAYLHSFHLQMVSSNVETERDLRRALALEDERRAGRRIPRRSQHPDALLYSNHVRYTEQLRRFHEVFPREQVLVLIYEEFLRDNKNTLREVLGFLGVDPARAIEPVQTYKVRSVRHLSLHYMANMARRARRNPAAASHLGRAVSMLTPGFAADERFRRRWRSFVYGAPPPPDPQLMAELRQRFKPEVQALSEYLGRDLVSLWGYDDVG